MTQTGGLVVLYAWLIFAGLLSILAWLLLRHEQDPLPDLDRPDPDDKPGTPRLAAGRSTSLELLRGRGRGTWRGSALAVRALLFAGVLARLAGKGRSAAHGSGDLRLFLVVPGSDGLPSPGHGLDAASADGDDGDADQRGQYGVQDGVDHGGGDVQLVQGGAYARQAGRPIGRSPCRPASGAAPGSAQPGLNPLP